MKVRWSPVLLEVNLIFILKEIIMPWNHDFQHFQVSVTHENYGPINPVGDRPHHTATPGRLKGLFFNDVLVYVRSVHTIMPINRTINFKWASSNQTIES